MSGIIGADNKFGQQFDHPDANMQGLITSIYDIGCAAGCIVAFFCGHILGRKRMILAGGTTMIIGTILLGSSYTVPQFLVGRIVTGIGNGINSSTVPAYQSEMAKPEIRGMLLSAQGTVTIVGLCIAYWLDYGMSFVEDSSQWRLPISFQGAFALLLVLQMIPLPDSPRWLCERGRVAEATEVITRLQPTRGTPGSDAEVNRLMSAMEASIEMESAGGPFRYKELFTGGKLQNWRRMTICGLINIFQQFTGANMINYYAPVVYETTMGLSRNLSLIMGGATSMAYLLGSLIPLWSMDRFGRRTSLMVSSSGLCFCFAMVSILLSIGHRPHAYAATAFVFLFQIFLAVGFLPVPWFYPSEVTTTRIRSRGQAFGGFINWMSVFTIVQITPTAVEDIGWKVFIIFACFCALWVPIVYCFFPETSGLDLEDLDYLFEDGGLTGGVFSSRGNAVQPGHHRSLQVAQSNGIATHDEAKV